MDGVDTVFFQFLQNEMPQYVRAIKRFISFDRDVDFVTLYKFWRLDDSIVESNAVGY